MQPDHEPRLIDNLIRIGTIAEVSYQRPPRARVQTGGLLTNWLRWLEARAGDTTDWDPPTMGEQVLILSPGGDLSAGIILRGLLSDAHPEPSNDPAETVRRYPDGTVYRHNHASGVSRLDGMRQFVVQAQELIHLKAPRIVLDADLTTTTGKHVIEGLLSYLAGMSGAAGKGSVTTITGDFTQSGGSLSSNGVVLHLHVHVEVSPGIGSSGKPK